MMPGHKNHTFSLKKICLIVSGGRKASTNLLQNFFVLLKFNNVGYFGHRRFGHKHFGQDISATDISAM